MSVLAIHGGPKTIDRSFAEKWPPVTRQDGAALAAMAVAGELSYYGREGKAEALEERFKHYIGTDYALATSSGTAALHSAFFALNLSPGDEVLVPTYTFLATVMPLFALNLVPVLVDADMSTGNIDPDDLGNHLTERTKAVVVTHMWGLPCNMKPIMAFARRHGLRVVEDCSHSHGAEVLGLKTGAIGDIAPFSLQGKKLVAAGQGGILTTSDPDLFERAVLFGHFKVRSFQDVKSQRLKCFAGTGLGLNYRIHPLAAEIACRQFDRLESYIEGRRYNFDYLNQLLHGIPGVQPPQIPAYAERCVWYSYKPLFDPDSLPGVSIERYIEALVAEGVEIERSETKPLHHEWIFQNGPGDTVATFGHFEGLANSGCLRRYRVGDLPNSESYAKRTLVLPPYTKKNRRLMKKIAEAFTKVAAQAGSL